MTDWFKIKCIFPVTTNVKGIETEEEEEDPILKRIRLKEAGVDDEYETEYAYFNLITDPIMHLFPMSLLAKDYKNKKSLTLIVFESGNTATAIGKPDDVFKELSDFIANMPEVTKE
jgi:hypothetical protein